MNAILAAAVNAALLSAGIAATLWFTLRMIPRRTLNAVTRYALWWFVLAITLLLPLAFIPRRHVPPLRTPTHAHSTAATPIPRPLNPEPRPAFQAPTPNPQPPTPISGPQPQFPAIRIPAVRWPVWVLWSWVAVAVLLLARLVVSSFLLARVSRRAADLPPLLRDRARTWAGVCLSSRPGVHLASSAAIPVPVAVGPRRPSILIPSALLDQLDDGELRQLVMHEAAHLARRDDYALMLERAIEALFALHPVVRWIARQIDLEREIACDDFVIAATGLPRSYANCLTRVVELSGGVRSSLVAAGAAEGRSHLARRVEMLLDKTRHTGTALLKRRFVATIAMLAVAAAIAANSPALIAFPKPLVRKMARLLPKLPPMAQAVEPAQPSNELSGRVVEDSSGNPVASAELRFHKPGMHELAADLETDRDGRFRATELPPGEYSVDLAKPNYVSTSFKLRVPSSGISLRMIRYGVIEGNITDSNGRPISGRILWPGGRTAGMARIALMVKSGEGEQLRLLRPAVVDEEGHYRIYDLTPGEYGIGLWYSGLSQGSGMQFYPDNAHPRLFTVAGGEEYRDVSFTVTSQESYSVSGKIDLQEKKQFQLALGMPEQPALPIAQTLTDPDGAFRFEHVPPGSYNLFVSGPTGGYGAFESILGKDEPLFGRTRIQVVAQDVQGVTVPLSPGKSVAVTLHAAHSEKPPAGCPQAPSIAFESLEPWAMMFSTRAQVPFGKEQTVRNMAPGRFRLVAADLGAGCYQVNRPVIDLSGDVPGPVPIELADAGSIRGVLKSGAARPSDFTVVLIGADHSDEARFAFPAADGRFEFVALRPGKYRIAARPTAAGRVRWMADAAQMIEIDVPGGSETTMELPVAQKGEGQ